MALKKVVVIIDGVSDLPCKQLDGKTPLEAAKTKNLDYMAKKSKMGYMYILGEKIAPQSDAAITSILGYNPSEEVRGPVEAYGSDIEFSRGDLVIRTNFATINNIKDRMILDRRAGRNLLTKETQLLAKAINEYVKLPCKFDFISTAQHRGVLVFRGGFSDNITNTDPGYGKGTAKRVGKKKLKMKFSEPLDDDENSKFSANLVNKFIIESYKILKEHPINKKRKEKGFYPANVLLTRDAGIELPKFKKLKGSWIGFAYMPLTRGLAKLSGMKLFTFKVPEVKTYDMYDFQRKLLQLAIKKAIKTLRKQAKNFSYAYIHFMETDVPGHDNKPLEKKAMIEMLDKKFFSFLKKFALRRKIDVAITADHTTACKFKVHTPDPVPVMVFSVSNYISNKRFTEKDSKDKEKCGARWLGKFYGKDFLKKVGFFQ